MKKKEQIIAWLHEIEAAMPERPKNLTEFEKGQVIYNSIGNQYKVTSFDGEVLRATEINSKISYKFKHESWGLFIYRTPHSHHSSRYHFFADKDAPIKIHERLKAVRLIDSVFNLIEKSELVKL